MATYGYVRVSTEMQDYDAQKEAIKRRYKIDFWFEDRGTGRKTQPNLERLIELVTPEDQVIVQAFDRLGRNMRNVLHIVSRFNEKKISLISIRECVDLSTPAGNMLFQMMGSIAEFECNMISERVKAGMYAACKRGVVLGAPKIDEDPHKSYYLRLAKKMRRSGMTLRKIQNNLRDEGFKISLGSLSTYVGKG